MLTSDTLTIRLATSVDYPAVVACIQAAFTKWIDIIGMKPFALTADYHDYINRGVTYVVEGNREDDLAGLLIIWQVHDALYVDTIAVNPIHQKQGLGSRLLSFAEQKAHEIGLAKLTLVTNAKMVANQEYYRKHGFVETHRHSFEADRVGVWMAKTLAVE